VVRNQKKVKSFYIGRDLHELDGCYGAGRRTLREVMLIRKRDGRTVGVDRSLQQPAEGSGGTTS
jgi:hypothetical protein